MVKTAMASGEGIWIWQKPFSFWEKGRDEGFRSCDFAKGVSHGCLRWIVGPYSLPSHSALKRSTNATMYECRSAASFRAVAVCIRSLSQKSFS